MFCMPPESLSITHVPGVFLVQTDSTRDMAASVRVRNTLVDQTAAAAAAATDPIMTEGTPEKREENATMKFLFKNRVRTFFYIKEEAE